MPVVPRDGASAQNVAEADAHLVTCRESLKLVLRETRSQQILEQACGRDILDEVRLQLLHRTLKDMIESRQASRNPCIAFLSAL